MRTLYFLIYFLSLNLLSQNVNFDAKNNVLTFPRIQNLSEDFLTGYPVYFDDQALEYYNKAIGHHYDNPNLAVEYYLKAIKKDPKFVQAYDNLGQLYRSLEEYNLAISCYKRSSDICPNCEVAHINLATLYKIIEDTKSAKKHYQKVIEIKPNSPEGYYGLGSIYRQENSLDKAEYYARKALKIYKSNNSSIIGDGYLLLGFIQYNKDEYDLAKENILLAKKKYQEHNIGEVFIQKVPSWLLTELSIK